jgi:hypothetical protein
MLFGELGFRLLGLASEPIRAKAHGQQEAIQGLALLLQSLQS